MMFEQMFNLSFWMWALGWNADATRAWFRAERVDSDTHTKID